MSTATLSLSNSKFADLSSVISWNKGYDPEELARVLDNATMGKNFSSPYALEACVFGHAATVLGNCPVWLQEFLRSDLVPVMAVLTGSFQEAKDLYDRTIRASWEIGVRRELNPSGRAD